MLTLEQYEKLIPSCHVTHEGTTISYLTPNTFPINEPDVRRDLLLYDLKVEAPPAAKFSF